jgi:hypothetical protein
MHPIPESRPCILTPHTASLSLTLNVAELVRLHFALRRCVVAHRFCLPLGWTGCEYCINGFICFEVSKCACKQLLRRR